MVAAARSGRARSAITRFEEIVREVRDASGVSVLVVEHDMELVMALSDHIFVVDFGRIGFDGSARRVRDSITVRQFYLGDSARPVEAG